jgi:hypothetical protein
MNLSPISFDDEKVSAEQGRRLPGQNYEQNYYRLVEAFKRGKRQLAFEDKKNAEIWASILRSNGLKPSVKTGFGPVFGGNGVPVDNYTVFVGGFSPSTPFAKSSGRAESLEQLVDKVKWEAYKTGTATASKAEDWITRELKKMKDARDKDDGLKGIPKI